MTSEIATDGDESMPPQNIPLCHVGYFELQTVEAQRLRKRFLISPLSVPKNLVRGFGPGRELSPETIAESLGQVWSAVRRWAGSVCSKPFLCPSLFH